MTQERYREPFRILEFPPVVEPKVEPMNDMDVSNMLNARMIARQGQINELQRLQAQDQAALVVVRESIRQTMKKVLPFKKP